MSRQIIKQPNGLFAEFSSNSDTIVAYDMTEDEVIGGFVQRAVERALQEGKKALEDVKKHGSSSYAPFNETWESALKLHEEHDGEPFKIEVTEELTKKVPPPGFNRGPDDLVGNQYDDYKYPYEHQGPAMSAADQHMLLTREDGR